MIEGDSAADAAFLAAYDPAAYPRLAVTVDFVLLTALEGELAVLVQQRREPPFAGHWALPGGFVGEREGLDQAARRLLAEKAGMADAKVEQLYTFGDPGRDPRMRIVTVAYYALFPPERLAVLFEDLALMSVSRAGPIAFDHAAILDHAIRRLRSRLGESREAFALLPERFTLLQLQMVHEAILGRSLNKPAFRRRMLDRGWIEGTGERENSGGAYRPAEFYRLRPPEDGL